MGWKVKIIYSTGDDREFTMRLLSELVPMIEKDPRNEIRSILIINQESILMTKVVPKENE